MSNAQPIFVAGKTGQLARAIADLAFERDLPLVTVGRPELDLADANSVEHTPVDISGAVEKGSVVVSVRDQGPGIAEADLPYIFDRFYRGRHTKNYVPGAGLGLFIAREIVRAHGGEIWAESTLGSGSVFHFSLPLAQGQEKDKR